MTNTFKQAIEQISELPPTAQELIGEELLLHVQKHHRLRSQIQPAARSLDHGGGRELEVGDVTKRARAQFGRA